MRSMIFLVLFFLTQYFSKNLHAQVSIIDHTCTNINSIPESAIIQAKDNLHIAYGHTSHGSQLTTGMNNLDAFMGGTGLYEWNDGPQEGALDIDDRFAGGDLGHNGDTTWAVNTRNYLDNSNNSDVNVIIWSWCGGASDNTEEGMQTYLDKMNQLEHDYPSVKFVYMTGHSDGGSETGNLHIRNQQIRDYCLANNKVLYNFYDIECYDPEGNYFGDKLVNDNCDYDTDGNGSRDGNWATEWQNSHSEGVDWYNCSAAHSQPLNGNRKAYAAWWLWARLAGWDGVTSIESPKNELPDNFRLNQNYPNPFNPTTNISFALPTDSNIHLTLLNVLGQEILELINENKKAGFHSYTFDASTFTSGIYFYRITADNFTETKRMVLMK